MTTTKTLILTFKNAKNKKVNLSLPGIRPIDMVSGFLFVIFSFISSIVANLI